MDLIDIKRIKNINVNNKNIITFEDGLNEYSFNITKSTLYKRFYMQKPLDEIDVQIIENPYNALAQLFNLNTKNIKLVFQLPQLIPTKIEIILFYLYFRIVVQKTRTEKKWFKPVESLQVGSVIRMKCIFQFLFGSIKFFRRSSLNVMKVLIYAFLTKEIISQGLPRK